ncbi:MAG: hypothetical protein HKN91_09790 [Acidimicrobiia bacterium]|nr:hypothetical protein [Acidimicrobiia bacterium]
MSDPKQITRREMLKRGAVVGGTVLWATPVVQTIGMGAAYAQVPSPSCGVYCISWSPTSTTNPVGGWMPSDGTGCLPCPDDATVGLPPDIADFDVSYNAGAQTYTVAYPDTCTLLSGEPTPDDLVNGSAAIRRGGDLNTCDFVTAGDQAPGLMPGTTQIQFTGWSASTADVIDLVIKCCN